MDNTEKSCIMEKTIKVVTSIQSSEYHWGREKVLALINSVEEFFDDFYDKSLKKKYIWNNVAEHMRGKGYSCSTLACEKKWRDLKNSYAHALQKQMQGESSQFEYFDALHHILGQEVDPEDANNQETSHDETAMVDDPAERLELSDNSDPAELENIVNGGQREKIKVRSEKELKRSNSIRSNSSSKKAKSKVSEGEGKTFLERVKNIESELSVKKRLERLEARVKSSRQQRETTKNTNLLLVKVLSELRKINAALKQEDPLTSVQRVQPPPSDQVTDSPTNQEFIIVETYADQL